MSVSAANLAYINATRRAQTDAEGLLRSYGYVAPGAGGSYSSDSLFGAFNPNKIINRDTGEIDENAFNESIKDISIGGSGRLADIQREGADIEAEARLASASGGIRGGLASQRTNLAEYQAAKNLSAGKTDFLNQVTQAYNPISGAFSNLKVAEADAATQKQLADAEADRLAKEQTAESDLFTRLLGSPSATPPANQPPAKPTSPGTRLYERRGPYQWLGKQGWKKVN